jgi:dienelactone hydrolase
MRAIFGFCTFIITMSVAIGAAIVPGYADDAAARIARELADNLANNRFVAAAERFAPEVARALPVETLQQVWNGVLQQGGAVREIAAVRSDQTVPGGSLVIIPIRLERMTIDLKVAVVGDKVAGLFMTPAAPAQGETWSPPGYADAAKFTTLDVTVGPSALGGTLSLPKAAGKVPAVVLIQGSGPLDRDETVGPNRPFRDLAEGLATRGIAALRYDKRTWVHPEQFTASSTVREETMDDVIAAVAQLAARPEIDAGRIIIVGHSLGGMLAPRIAEGGHGIAAVVILAGASRPLPSIIVEQTEYLASLSGPADAATRQRIDEIKREAARAWRRSLATAGPTFWGRRRPIGPTSTAMIPPQPPPSSACRCSFFKPGATTR